MLCAGLRLGLIACLTLCATDHVRADAADGLPSCYAANGIKPFGPLYDKTFVVLIDQTVQLDQNLETQVLHSLDQMIQPGTHVIVGEFSAFSQGRYLNIAQNMVVEAPIPADRIGDVIATELDPFNRCLADQIGYAKRTAEQAAYSIMQNSTSSLAQSDIVMSLKDVSAPIESDRAASKVVLLVTDGLENSTVTSFYGHGTARDINPKMEMAKTQAAGMVGDFGGARIYLIGGALEPPAKVGARSERNGYRNPQMLVHLQDFWDQYFQASNAKLEGFGTPALLSPVQY